MAEAKTMIESPLNVNYHALVKLDRFIRNNFKNKENIETRFMVLTQI